VLAHIFVGQSSMTGMLIILGLGIGYGYPVVYIERKARARGEDILYYLPLVIEQISIGVSSALDIGPCIAEVVSMADERGSHNPVTELFVHVEKLMRSGLSLEESLMEVSEVNGQQELKHAFMFLAQCAKHGGEISKQLQELADATMTSRQVYVEGRIAALPVKATGPLATVFAGFFALLFAGLMVRLVDAFGGGAPGG
jgi:pilus assembly protein TadC